MTFYPRRMHGHTFGPGNGGPRKDSVIVTPHQTVTVDFDVDNRGQWIPLPNIYHAETGVMVNNLAYYA